MVLQKIAQMCFPEAARSNKFSPWENAPSVAIGDSKILLGMKSLSSAVISGCP